MHAFLTSPNSSSRLTVSESVNLSFFFFSFSPSQHLNFNSTFASNLPHYFFFLFTFSPSRRLDLGLALCALLSTSRLHQVLILFFWFLFWLLDSLSFIWSFSRCFFLFFIFYFISDSPFMFLALFQVLRSVTLLVSGNFYQLLVYNSILVYLWFCVCYGFDLQSIIVVKYSLQSIILLFVYVVLMNLFVDKMVAAVVLRNLFVNKMVSL